MEKSNVETPVAWDHFVPRDEGVTGIIVNRRNAKEAVKLFGGSAEEESKSSDPTDVAMIVSIPTLTGPVRVVLREGYPFVVTKDDEGRLSVWTNVEEFNRKYKIVKPAMRTWTTPSGYTYTIGYTK